MSNELVSIPIILFLATLIETLVEAVIGPIFDHTPAIQPYKWMQMYIAIAVGIAATFICKLDLLHLFSMYISTDPSTAIPAGWFGMTLTGAAIGRGSNYVHDLVGLISKAKA